MLDSTVVDILNEKRSIVQCCLMLHTKYELFLGSSAKISFWPVKIQGQLQSGVYVAVKVLSVELESMRGEREFISEIAALSDIKHENLVTLLGCCVDGAKRLLVYDYMENNCLAHAFLGNCRLEF